jgi:hypothetical protein
MGRHARCGAPPASRRTDAGHRPRNFIAHVQELRASRIFGRTNPNSSYKTDVPPRLERGLEIADPFRATISGCDSRSGCRKSLVLEGADVGIYVALSCAGRDRRGGDYPGARPDQHDARRLAQPLAKADAPARAVPVRRHHHHHGDDLGDGPLRQRLFRRRLARHRPHIFDLLLRLFHRVVFAMLLLFRGEDRDGRCLGGMGAGAAGARRRCGRQRQERRGNCNCQKSHDYSPLIRDQNRIR